MENIAEKIKLLNKENISDLPKNSGIYRIFAYSQNFEPIIINRFAKRDKQGLLYIGRTKNLNARLNNFLLSSDINKNTHNHSGALKYKKKDVIRKTLKKHTLYFNFQVLNEINEEEKKLLDNYSNEFGEYPPLNK